MKKTFTFLLGISLLLGAGCSQNTTTDGGPTASATATPSTTGTPASAETPFMLALSDAEVVAFEPTVQKVDLRRDTQKSALVLGNYDFVLMPMSANSIDEVTEGQVRVHVGLKGGDKASYEEPMPVGEYDASETYVDILTFKDGNEMRTNVDGEAGTIVITESDENHVAGTLDITGEGGAVIKGEFDAVVATEENAKGGGAGTPTETPAAE